MGELDSLESAIANYELAFRMQSAVPDLLSLASESAATKALYGMDEEYAPTRLFGRQCLVARRLVERGVRFVELLCPERRHRSLGPAQRPQGRATRRTRVPSTSRSPAS